MLKINRILFKKIKFPLSLRGAKQRSNRKGFSLIELMFAVVILAIVIFGIFHAYSVCFMGMTYARDRTVATNLAQKKIEDIKNTPFGNIADSSTTTEEISGKILTIDLISINSTVGENNDSNLKEVTVTVSWFDRNGNQKNVVTKTLIYNND
jgi:prepilin-type N-terminal cleavage/methylation domain-containing protein